MQCGLGTGCGGAKFADVGAAGEGFLRADQDDCVHS